MMKELYFAWYAIKKNIQSSAELRTSFLMNIVGMAINNTAFIFLWAYFVKSVGIIGGWTIADIIGLQGFGALSFGIVFSVARGIRNLPDYTANGVFDRFMLSPKNLLVRVATSALGVSALGDVIFGITCLVIYAILIQAGLLQIFLTIVLVAVSTLVFLAAIIIIYSVSFFFTDANPATTSLFELFFTPSIFSGGAFQGVMRFIFTFIIPSLLIGSLPVEVLRDIDIGKLALISGLSIIWFFISIKFFYMAVKKYESSNFMTFGG
jgi:ABC-2 type transport system permease protein